MIPEPSRKQLEEKAIAYYDKLHSVGQFVSIDHVAPAFIAGHASRDAEVAQLKDLLERAKAFQPPQITEVDKSFDHPCKGVCSGWQHGFVRGAFSMENRVVALLEENTRLSKEIESLKFKIKNLEFNYDSKMQRILELEKELGHGSI